MYNGILDSDSNQETLNQHLTLFFAVRSTKEPHHILGIPHLLLFLFVYLYMCDLLYMIAFIST